MGGDERAGYANSDRDGELPRRLAAGCVDVVNVRAEVDPLDPLHHQIEVAVLLDEVVDGRDVRTLEVGAHPRFLDEHVDVRGLLGQMRVHLLDRYGPAKAAGAVELRPPHRGHPPAARNFDQSIFVPDDFTGLVNVDTQNEPLVAAVPRSAAP